MKTLLSTALLLAFSASLSAQSDRPLTADEQNQVLAQAAAAQAAASDTIWKTGGNVTLGFGQTYLSNWSAGGQSSINFNSLVNLFANYRKNKSSWDNALIMAYGAQRIADGDLLKVDDRIDLTSRYGYSLSENWQASFLLNFRSQFLPGYEIVDNTQTDNVLSEFLSPAYILLAPGVTYKPNDNFNVVLSPATSKIIVVMEDSLATLYGLDAGDNVRYELGAYVRVAFKKELMTNINYTTTLDLFSNYLEDPQNVDVNWDNVLGFKVNDYISGSLAWTLIYDDNVDVPRGTNQITTIDDTGAEIVTSVPNLGPGMQFRQLFTLGFSYNFGVKK